MKIIREGVGGMQARVSPCLQLNFPKIVWKSLEEIFPKCGGNNSLHLAE
jgi:hypothetical protein